MQFINKAVQLLSFTGNCIRKVKWNTQQVLNIFYFRCLEIFKCCFYFYKSIYGYPDLQQHGTRKIVMGKKHRQESNIN